jgi:hypothetical protein
MIKAGLIDGVCSLPLMVAAELGLRRVPVSA